MAATQPNKRISPLKTMKIIDPHIHLFNLEQGHYDWLKSDYAPFWPDKDKIQQSFTEQDITLDSPLTLAGFIHIEAGFNNAEPWLELAWLEQHCTKPFKTIATIDLTLSSDEFAKQLAKLSTYPSFIGVRHLLDDQPAGTLRKKQVLTNFKTLNKLALCFETQLSLTDISATNKLADVVASDPHITFIINHMGFPPQNENSHFQDWKNNLSYLARFSNVVIKCSGWEMINRKYSLEWMNKILTTIYDIFGHKRMMLASNFPLCLFSQDSYQTYWHLLINLTFFQSKTMQVRKALLHDNALHFYKLTL